VLPWLEEGVLDKANSYVIGDRATDISWRITWALPACAMTANLNWPTIGEQLTRRDRYAHVERITKETRWM
jgi:imidazoleglycerol-phosphate dehydratase/histidinol-phosphatase